MRRSKLMSEITPWRVRPRTDMTTSPISACSFGNSWVSSRPTISVMSFWRSSSDAGSVATCFPSRNTVTLSAILNTSSILCVM